MPPLKLMLSITLLLISCFAEALTSITLDIGDIKAAHWQLQAVKMVFSDINKSKEQLALNIAQLKLPAPFTDISLVAIHCTAFSWQNQELNCEQGHAKLHSPQWQSPQSNFSFAVNAHLAVFKLTELHFLGGLMSITATEQGSHWEVSIHGKGINSQAVLKLFPTEWLELKTGSINFEMNITGSNETVNTFALTAATHNLTGQSKDGRVATENANLEIKLNAEQQHGVWQWQTTTRLLAGAFYVEPLFLKISGKTITLKALGNLDASLKRVDISSVDYVHEQIGKLSGSLLINYQDAIHIEKAAFSLTSTNLKALSALYVKPFLEQTAYLTGIGFAGNLNAAFQLEKNRLASLSAQLEGIEITDAKKRVSLKGGSGSLNWSNAELFSKPSTVSWQQLKLNNVPVGAASLTFLTRAHNLHLLKPADIPLLGGSLAIHQLGWQEQAQGEPIVYFEGDLKQLSLAQLSTALNWTPLSGIITGTIPRIEYAHETLTLNGEIVIKVFDGFIKISKLAASNILTGKLPRFFSELEFDNLDLEQLTRQFKFGSITGKLSGYVRQLTLENWKPVSFYAWFGTPADDNSSHRISQKAVQNIANIGGGGASDLVSRSFLTLFDTFGYDKIGLGCYLHNNVCQLMGIETTPTGYLIIKGGGLPRIEVIGYNTKLDWAVLMQRLSRIATTDEVIIK